jgi:putative oxidoreductase
MDKLKVNAHWLLRAVLAAVFLYHGLTKFPAAAMMAKGMGMPIVMIYLLGMMETVGGVLILLGGLKKSYSDLATKVAAVIFAVVMIGAIMMVHWPQWSFVANAAKPMGGMEFQVTLLALSIYLFLKSGEA